VGRWLRALTRNAAETALNAEDARLRGRTYAIPFEDVWQCALELVRSSPRWTLRSSDDVAGVIQAEARSLLLRRSSDVRIAVSLDADAQTRVEVRSATRDGKADLGSNARRIHRFLRALDRLSARRRARVTAGGTPPPA
jgi:uncharacterized protein (DUF1499 family)